MRAMHGRWRIPAWTLALALAAPASAAPAPTTAPSPCAAFALSPSFVSDGTAFCATLFSKGPTLWRTTDRGGSWTRFDLAPGVLPLEQRPALRDLIVSPRYAVDRAVYLQTSVGLYVTTNPADGLRPVDLLASANDLGVPNLTPYVDATAGAVSAGERVVFAYAAQQRAARIDPPLHSEVPAAAPNYALQFLVPQRATLDVAPLLVGLRPDPSGAGRHSIALYQCDASLTCATQLHAFPPPAEFRGAWLSPAYDRDGTLFVALATGKRYLLYRSTDRGRTFAPWAGASKVLAAVNAEMSRGDGDTGLPLALAIDPANPRLVFLRVAQRSDTPRLPAQQLFRSRDGGATWTRTGIGWVTPGRPDTLPWDAANPLGSIAANQSAIHVANGRVFALGQSTRDGYSGVFCSTDAGRTWARACR
ncbi:MAG TPA: hypothetical protein VNA20_16710 [Frankiaceae bacterium]|nr:hypothetical protein [Frankiaceae bacterium]